MLWKAGAECAQTLAREAAEAFSGDLNKKKCRNWPFWGFWRHFPFDYLARLLNIGAIERDIVRVREMRGALFDDALYRRPREGRRRSTKVD
jgi:hypothetical protein